ncbi:hypothetical protein BGZ54_004398, partial [Gamsiella multidivaricata]
MSTAQVIAPAPMAGSPRRGLSTIRTIFSTNTLKRHSIAQFPSDRASATPTTPSFASSIVKSPSSMSSLFPTSNPRRSMDKAAERDWKEQAKQVFQLSTINDQGNFLPPPPLEKGIKEDLDDVLEEDFFATIISTPPEKVRTFLSTESTISPGMFSLPSSKIKRNTIPAFSSPPPSPTSTARPYQDDTIEHNSSSSNNNNNNNNNSSMSDNKMSTRPRSEHTFSDVDITTASSPSIPADTIATPASTPPAAPSIDAYFAPSPPGTPRPRQLRPQSISNSPEPQEHGATQVKSNDQGNNSNSNSNNSNNIRSKTRAQLSFLTGAARDEDILADLLSDSLESLLSSSPSDLMMGSEESSDLSPSPEVSSLSSPSVQKEKIRRLNAQRLRAQNNFRGELR